MQIHTTGIGDITVHAIEDGHFLRKPTDMFPLSDETTWTPDQPGFDGEHLRISLGCFLLETPDGHVMVDTGIGAFAGDVGGVGGDCLPALEHLGVDPAEVRAVVHTHLHGDHISGNLLHDRSIAYPNARFYVHERELAFWESTDRPGSEVVRDRFGVITSAGMHRTFVGDVALTGRLAAMETPGHTPGHISVLVDGGDGSKLVITGDVTHHPVQAAHPDWSIAFDVDGDQAAETRARVFALLADEGWTQASGHDPRPGFGNVTRSEDNFVMTLGDGSDG